MSLSAVRYRLKALGRLELARADGTSVDSVLSQPKRLALLVYLAVANRGALCRRDTVLGVFWPEFDHGRARAALRKALHFLRRELGYGMISGLGDEEIGVYPNHLSSDVSDFENAIRHGVLDTALGAYDGDFLCGFYVSGAPQFEQWTEATRSELKSEAVGAAERLTHNALDTGASRAAVRGGREWVRQAPMDEGATRALMRALAESGEAAEAVEQYVAFVSRLQNLDIEPSTETRTLASKIRHRTTG